MTVKQISQNEEEMRALFKQLHLNNAR